MKTIISLFIFATFLTGCEKPKDYKCVCKITEESMFGGQPRSREETYTIHDKKRKAVSQCDGHEPSGVQVWTKTDCAVQ